MCNNTEMRESYWLSPSSLFSSNNVCVNLNNGKELPTISAAKKLDKNVRKSLDFVAFLLQKWPQIVNYVINRISNSFLLILDL